jgi:hypothetical protein
MINQCAYPDIILGFGSRYQTVARYGCYMCSVLQGLLDRGYKFTVNEWNELLKSSGVYNKDRPTVLSSSILATKLPDIFTYGANEAWNDENIINYINDRSYVVVGEVNAKGIDGSGQHFVYIRALDKSDGKIIMTHIGDPWGGLNQKVTVRYNQFGNILSLRVFKIKPINPISTNTESMSDKLLNYLGVSQDDEAIIKLKEHLGEKDKKCNWGAEGDNGGFLGTARASKSALSVEIDGLKGTIKELQDKHDNFVEKLIGVLNGSNPLGLSDEELVNKLVSELINNENTLQEKIKQMEQSATQKEKELTEKNAQLQKDLDSLGKEISDLKIKHEQEIKTLEKRLEQAQSSISQSNDEKDDFELLKRFLKAIKDIFNK